MWPLVRHVLTAAGGLVYPPQCLLCDEPLDAAPRPHSLCDPCRSALTADPHDTCPRCSSTVGPHTDLADGCPRCRGEAYAFASAFRLGPYDGKLREAVLRLKNLSGETLAETLGLLWVESRRAHFDRVSFDVVIPIPLHWTRRLGRGYNQSAAVARMVARELNRPSRPGWLRRIRRTPHQTGLPSSARRENVRHAFRTSPFARLRGGRVLLVDDVLTTGATADAASRALLAGGAAQVSVAVLSHR